MTWIMTQSLKSRWLFGSWLGNGDGSKKNLLNGEVEAAEALAPRAPAGLGMGLHMSYAMVKVTWVPWVTMGYGHNGHPIIINGIPRLMGI